MGIIVSWVWQLTHLTERLITKGMWKAILKEYMAGVDFYQQYVKADINKQVYMCHNKDMLQQMLREWDTLGKTSTRTRPVAAAPSGVQTRTAKDFGPDRGLENPFAVARNQNNYVSPT